MKMYEHESSASDLFDGMYDESYCMADTSPYLPQITDLKVSSALTTLF